MNYLNTHCSFFHPWHSLSYGEDAPAQVTVLIEIQQGGKAKYELDKETGLLRLDRILASPFHYPCHYGFIPQTYCDDEDPLDILVISSEPLLPLSIVDARVVGAFTMIDSGQQDDKIIAVAAHDPVYAEVTSYEQLDSVIIQKIRIFFEGYKKPEGKEVVIKELVSPEQAYVLIQEAAALYQHVFHDDEEDSEEVVFDLEQEDEETIE